MRVCWRDFEATCSEVDLGLGFVVIVRTFREPKTSDSFVVGCRCPVRRTRAGGENND